MKKGKKKAKKFLFRRTKEKEKDQSEILAMVKRKEALRKI